MSKEATLGISCITVISCFDVSLIAHNRLTLPHNVAWNDRNRIFCGHFRKCTSFQESLILLFFELELNFSSDLCWHWEKMIIYWSRCVCKVWMLKSSGSSVNLIIDCLNWSALQHVHELTWFNVNSVSTLHIQWRDSDRSRDRDRLFFILFCYIEINKKYCLILTQIASLGCNCSDRWRSWFDNLVFINLTENLVNHFVKLFKFFILAWSARLLWGTLYLSLMCWGISSRGLRFLYKVK